MLVRGTSAVRSSADALSSRLPLTTTLRTWNAGRVSSAASAASSASRTPAASHIRVCRARGPAGLSLMRGRRAWLRGRGEGRSGARGCAA